MHLVGSKSQNNADVLYDASGTITTGGTPQLVLPVTPSRSHFFFQNNSTHVMWLEIGSARGVATLSGNGIASIAVTNAGFNFTYPPVIRFAGGGGAGNPRFLGLNQPGGAGPTSSTLYTPHPKAHCVLTSNAVSSIVVDEPGAGFVIAPFVFIFNSDLDPYGCAVPSSGVGIQVSAGGGSVYYNGTVCFTDSISVLGTTTADPYTCKWML